MLKPKQAGLPPAGARGAAPTNVVNLMEAEKPSAARGKTAERKEPEGVRAAGRPRGRGAMGPTPNARQKALHSCNSREKMAQAPPFTGRSWTQVIVSGQIRSGAQMKQRSYSPGCADAIRGANRLSAPAQPVLDRNCVSLARRCDGTPKKRSASRSSWRSAQELSTCTIRRWGCPV